MKKIEIQLDFKPDVPIGVAHTVALLLKSRLIRTFDENPSYREWLEGEFNISVVDKIEVRGELPLMG